MIRNIFIIPFLTVWHTAKIFESQELVVKIILFCFIHHPFIDLSLGKSFPIGWYPQSSIDLTTEKSNGYQYSNINIFLYKLIILINNGIKFKFTCMYQSCYLAPYIPARTLKINSSWKNEFVHDLNRWPSLQDRFHMFF